MSDLERRRQLTAARVRRHRQRQKELAEEEADILARRVRWYADRLLAEEPEAARVLAEVPYDLAGPLVDELKEHFAAS